MHTVQIHIIKSFIRMLMKFKTKTIRNRCEVIANFEQITLESELCPRTDSFDRLSFKSSIRKSDNLKPRDEVTHLTRTSFVHIARSHKHVSSGLDTANHANTVTDEQTSNCSQIFVR